MTLMEDQPNIDPVDLQNIKSPVLIIAGDRDMIREEHSVLIYQNIPKSQLWIIPARTHFAPINQSGLFNEKVYRFLKNRSRLRLMKSVSALQVCRPCGEAKIKSG